MAALLVACGPPAAGQPAGTLTPCTMHRIVDGDSIECRQQATTLRVRLLGVDAPELQQRPFGTRARDILARLLPIGSEVRLETDVRITDPYGRLLAWVWNDSTRLVNEEMLRTGFAVVYIVPPNVKYSEALRDASHAAQRARLGLWATSAFDCPPSEFRRQRCR